MLKIVRSFIILHHRIITPNTYFYYEYIKSSIKDLMPIYQQHIYWQITFVLNTRKTSDKSRLHPEIYMVDKFKLFRSLYIKI